jgi:urease accessory protein
MEGPVGLGDGPGTGWKASLSVTLGPAGGRTVVKRLRFEGPLRIQRLFHPETGLPDICHLYLLHPPGGLVTGDLLEQELTLAEGARALVTSPAATKVYRAKAGPGPNQRVVSRVTLGDGATLEWLPQGTIVFGGARADLSTLFEVGPGARALGCDFVALGRPAAGEGFGSGSLRQLTRVFREGRPLFHELVSLPGGSPLLASPFGLMGRPVMALFWALGRPGEPSDEAALKGAMAEMAAWPDFGPGPNAPGPPVFSATLRRGMLLARALAQTLGEAEDFRARVWSAVRPRLMGREPLAPHIWNT